MRNGRIEEARRLRREGMSLRDIEKLVPAARSSISLWVRDIQLTDEQKKKLVSRNPALYPVFRINELQSNKFRVLRKSYQDEGRQMARRGTFNLHLVGCMLYWAEGTKNRNKTKLANTDVGILKIFVRFLKECYGVPESDFRVRVNCYTDKGKTKEEIEDFWLSELGFSRTALGKTLVNYDPRGKNNNKRKKRTWGTCEVSVLHGTKIVQNIFGAIQEYSGMDNPEWLDILPGTNAGMV